MLKDFFVLQIFTNLPRLFGHLGKQFDKKQRLTSQFMTSQTGQ